MADVCPQCEEPLGGKVRLIREEECGHLKCRKCLLDEDDGCRQCLADSEIFILPGKVSLNEASEEPAEESANEILEGPLESEKSAELSPYELDCYENLNAAEAKSFSMTSDDAIDVMLNSDNLIEVDDPIVYDDGGESSEDLQGKSGGKSKSKVLPNHVVALEYYMDNEEIMRGYKCSICSKTFKSPYQIKYHLYCDPSVEKPNKCSECKETFRTGYQLKQHMQLHQNVSFSCNVCGKVFAHDASARKHSRKHSENPPPPPPKAPSEPFISEYPCTICDKTFARRDYLKKHMICHNGGKRFKCERCDRQYARFNALKYHIETTHEKNLDFTCSTCNKRFNSFQGLQRHLTTHTHALRLACKICGLRSTRKDNLIRHIRSFHAEVEKPVTAINFNVSDEPAEVIQIATLDPTEIRSKEAHLRKNVIVSYAKEERVGEDEDQMIQVDSLESTIVVLGMQREKETATRKESTKKEGRKGSTKQMDIYRKILLDNQEEDVNVE